MKNKSAVIIGSGLAGLSAALNLTNKNFDITIFEKNSFAGGKLYSLKIKSNSIIEDDTRSSAAKRSESIIIDNSPHLILSGNDYLLKYLIETNSLTNIEFQKKFNLSFYIQNKNKIFKFVNYNGLTHILNLLLSMSKFPEKNFWDIIKLIKFQLIGKLNYYDKVSGIKEFLENLGFSFNIIESFFKNFIQSTLNTKIDEAIISYFYNVLNKTFFSVEKKSLAGLFKKNLYDSMINNAVKILKFRNCKIFFKTPVRNIIWNAKTESIDGLVINSEIKKFDYYIFALPPDCISIPSKKFEFLKSFQYSPIICFQMIYDGDLVKERFLGFFDEYFDWIFKRKISGNIYYYSFVKSCADNLFNIKDKVLEKNFLDKIKKYFPKLEFDRIKFLSIIKDKKATVKSNKHNHILKQNLTKLNYTNYRIIGAWTDKELPATIESAVKSGYEIRF